MWAGFLSWPLVKQTSKVGQTKTLAGPYSLIYILNCLQHLLYSASSSGLASPSAILHFCPRLLLYLINHEGIVMVKLLPSYSDTTLQRGSPCLNRQAADKRLLTQQSALYRRQSSCTVTWDTSCYGTAQDRMHRCPNKATTPQSSSLKHDICAVLVREFNSGFMILVAN